MVASLRLSKEERGRCDREEEVGGGGEEEERRGEGLAKQGWLQQHERRKKMTRRTR